MGKFGRSTTTNVLNPFTTAGRRSSGGMCPRERQVCSRDTPPGQMPSTTLHRLENDRRNASSDFKFNLNPLVQGRFPAGRAPGFIKDFINSLRCSAFLGLGNVHFPTGERLRVAGVDPHFEFRKEACLCFWSYHILGMMYGFPIDSMKRQLTNVSGCK